MNKQAHWRYGLLAALVSSAALFALWPRPLPHTPPAALTDTDSVGTAAGVAEAPAADGIPALGTSAAAGAAGKGKLLNQQAMNAWHRGEIREAMSLFEQAIAVAPDEPAAFSNYGRLLTLMIEYQRALPLLQHAHDLRPGDAQPWLDLATLYERAQLLQKSWAARAEAEKLVGADAITRDEQGRFVVQGNSL